MEPIPEYKVRIVDKTLIARDMLGVRVERPPGFVFKAGQFVQWVIPRSEGEVLRSYSLASHPEDVYLEFCIKLLPEGKGSQHIASLPVGDSLVFKGPLGHFVCDDTHGVHKVFVATGAGIAPVWSMVVDEVTKNHNQTVQLLFGVRAQEDTFWINRFDDLQKRFNHFTYQITLSQPVKSWEGLRGRVTNHLETLPLDADYYLCGSVGMIKDVRQILKHKGVQLSAIHIEIF